MQVFVFYKIDKTIVHYAQEKMLKNRLVLNSSEDELGNIWLATNTVLSMLQTVKILQMCQQTNKLRCKR
jgi:hypothetical protein